MLNKRNEKDELELRFGQYQIEYEKELYDRLKEQFESEFNEKLDQVNKATNNRFFFLLA